MYTKEKAFHSLKLLYNKDVRVVFFYETPLTRTGNNVGFYIQNWMKLLTSSRFLRELTWKDYETSYVIIM